MFLAGAVALAATASCASAQSLVIHGLNRIDETQVVTLEGNVHPLARAEFDQGPVNPETRLERMVLLLKPSPAQQTALDALVEAQQNPGSPLYHQWLTPAEYGAQFGVSEPELAQVTAWLTAQGFTVDEIPAGRQLVVFSGTAGQVFDAFHTEMHVYRVNGAEHIANAQDPQIPAALAERGGRRGFAARLQAQIGDEDAEGAWRAAAIHGRQHALSVSRGFCGDLRLESAVQRGNGGDRKRDRDCGAQQHQPERCGGVSFHGGPGGERAPR